MTWTLALVRAVAETLDAEGVALWAPAGPYPTSPSLPVITIGGQPDQPEQVVTLSPYGVEDTVHEHSTVGLQVRSRGGRDPQVAYAIDDAVFLVLHRSRGFTAGTTAPVDVAVSWRASGPAPIGVDDAGRFELSSNYYLRLARPSADPWS